MRRPVSAAALASLAFFFALNAAAAWKADAQSYFVSANGNDGSGNGTKSRPWATISYAARHAGPGAVVHVQAGAYSGGVSTSSSGTAGAYIVYEGDDPSWQPVNCAQIAADHGNPSQCPRLLNGWENSGNYVEIRGFDVTAAGINGIYTQGNATIITENHVHNILPAVCNSIGGSGINLNGAAAEVTGNYVHNIGPYPSACGYVQGIYFLQPGGYAYNNISFDNSGFGIQLWHYPSNIVLANNTIFDNASGGIVLGTDNSNVTVDSITVANNIVADNGGVGISEQGCCSTSTGIHNVYENNLLYGNRGGGYSLQNGLTSTGTVDASPGFVADAGDQTGNYHLQADSPAIGAGLGSASPAADFDGNSRPQNGQWDIGAYEFMNPDTSPLAVSPTSGGFAGTDAGSSSPAQTFTLTNQGPAPVALSGISITGSNSSSFVQKNGCGASVAAGANCAIDVTFAPQTVGALKATLTIAPVSGSALQVSLSGTSLSSTAAPRITPEVFVAPLVSNLPAAQPFSVTVRVSGGAGDPIPAGNVELTSSGYASAATPLTNGMAAIPIPAESLPAGSNELDVTYSPDASSSTTYNGATGTASIVVTASAFSISATPVTIAPGRTGLSTATISSSTDYAGIVSLVCVVTGGAAGAAVRPTCTATQTVRLSSATASGTAAVSVSSPAAINASTRRGAPNATGWVAAGGTALALLLLPPIPETWRKLRSLALAAIATVTVSGVSACGAAGLSGPFAKSATNSLAAAGQYTVAVTATGDDPARTTASTTFILTVK